MNFYNVLSLFGGLAMFLYGMRLMGDSLKESSSGALKVVMEKATGSAVRAFLLGLAVTALIQSSTATIVITSGLVAAGIISLRQSLGIIVGANVGTTVTGQIIRLLDLDSSAVGWLQLFRPSTLAPVALIIGAVLIMGFSFRGAKSAGNIAIGFGILFSGLLNMTAAVDTLSSTGLFERLLSKLGSNPFLGYGVGAGVSFILQSSSAAVGILQAFSASGGLHFYAIYAVIVGIYLGDCVTTAIVCAIGAKPDARRVGVVNVLYNLGKSVLVLLAVTLLHRCGLLDKLWNRVATPGVIADTNTVFNLVCAICLFPLLPACERLSRKLVPVKAAAENKYRDRLDSLNPAFFSTPALALRSCYDVLMTMLLAARENIRTALGLLRDYDETLFRQVSEEEDNVDLLTDALCNYMYKLSGHVSADLHVSILDQYHKVVTEFERLSDHAMNLAETAQDMSLKKVTFSPSAQKELLVLEELIEHILDETEKAFRSRDVDAARHIEPLEQVVDDMVYAMREDHLARLRAGKCSIDAGTAFMNVLGDLERVSDLCSNVGVAVVARVAPSRLAHEYVSSLHAGQDESYTREYTAAHDEYFARLEAEKND